MKKVILLIAIFSFLNIQASNTYNNILNDIRILEKQGKYLQMDSLFSILDSSGNISSHDLMKWAEAKFITGDEINAARLYCRAESGRLRFLVRNSFLSNLKDLADPQKGQLSLKAYFDCKSEVSDSLPFIDWSLRATSSLNYYTLELNFIDSFFQGKKDYTDELLSSSMKRISKGFPKEAIKTAIKAFNSTESTTKKNQAAGYIFKSFLMLGENDSAFQWMKKAELNRTTEITEAIILCQKTGNNAIADSLCKTLPIGINRDTLVLRNLVYSNNVDQALNNIIKLRNKYNQNYSDALLHWHCRLLLYTGKNDKFIEILNTDNIKKIPFNNEYKTDFLKWKTALIKLENDPKAIKVFGKISHFNFTGNYLPYNPFLTNKHWSIEIKEFLLIEYLSGIISNNGYSFGKPLLNEIPDNTENIELLYYKGIININNDLIESGRKILEELILNGKGSLFSQKARMYLLENFSQY